MKKYNYLTAREEELLNFFWQTEEPLTAGEMADRLEEDGWNTATLFKTVRALSDRGYLKVAGLEKNAKSYARKFMPALLHICSISTVILLYPFCALRLMLPVELPWTRVASGGRIYNIIYQLLT